MIEPGKTVRFRDGQNRNFQALVVDVHGSDDKPTISIVYVSEPGKVTRVNMIQHRTKVDDALVGKGTPHWI